MEESSHRNNAQARGKGSVGKDLPMSDANKHGDMLEKSMPDTGMGALDSGFTDMGKITSATKSAPAMQGPGQNNKNSRI